jgi:site-specific recombinase XerD
MGPLPFEMPRSRPSPRRSRPLPIAISPEQFRALVGVIPTETRAGRRNRALLCTMWDAGLRVSEAIALSPLDLTVDPVHPTLAVRHGKGDRHRVIPISADLAEMLEEWSSELSEEAPFLFPTLARGHFSRLDRRYVWEVVARYAELANVLKPAESNTRRPINPHVLRHSYATRMIANGVGLRDLQYLLGHSSIATTEIYTHVVDNELGSRVRAVLAGAHADRGVEAARRRSWEELLVRHIGTSGFERVSRQKIAGLLSELPPDELLLLVGEAAQTRTP